MFFQVPRDSDAKCKLCRAKVTDPPVAFEFIFKADILIRTGGGRDNVIDMNGKNNSTAGELAMASTCFNVPSKCCHSLCCTLNAMCLHSTHHNLKRALTCPQHPSTCFNVLLCHQDVTVLSLLCTAPSARAEHESGSPVDLHR